MRIYAFISSFGHLFHLLDPVLVAFEHSIVVRAEIFISDISAFYCTSRQICCDFSHIFHDVFLVIEYDL